MYLGRIFSVKCNAAAVQCINCLIVWTWNSCIMHTRFQNVPIVLLFLWVAASVVPCHASITCDFAQAIPVGLVTNRTGKVFFQGPGSNTDLLDFFGSLLDPYSGWPVGFLILSTTILFDHIIDQLSTFCCFIDQLSTNHQIIINTKKQERNRCKIFSG